MAVNIDDKNKVRFIYHNKILMQYTEQWALFTPVDS